MSEYKEMAKYYDLFYKNKTYEKEVDFLINLIGNRKTILDLGCGTGVHMQLLEERGYIVDGLDLSPEMLLVARSRVKGNLYKGNLLDFSIDKKYDAIISMFAVFNHLKSYEEFERGITNALKHLNKDGVLIIDLHNKRESGSKENNYGNYKRIMKWDFDNNSFKEKTTITYEIDGKIYTDQHEFLIYEVDKIKTILVKHNLKYIIYENYINNEANDNSKNIEIIIYK